MCRFIPALCVTAAVVAPVVAQAPAGRSFELRTYHAAPGRLDELHARFRQHALPLLQRHGAEVVGTWVPKPNPDNTVIAMLAYPSPAAREAVWSGVVADPQWARMKRGTDGRGLLVEAITELPLTAAGPLKGQGLRGDLELRTHATLEPTRGAVGAWVPTRPRPGVALVTLHPRRADDVQRVSGTLVSTLLTAPPTNDAERVTVLSPTDYSPVK